MLLHKLLSAYKQRRRRQLRHLREEMPQSMLLEIASHHLRRKGPWLQEINHCQTEGHLRGKLLNISLQITPR